MADNTPQKKKVTKKTVETIRTIETTELVDVPEEKENPPTNGNLLRGIVNWSGVA